MRRNSERAQDTELDRRRFHHRHYEDLEPDSCDRTTQRPYGCGTPEVGERPHAKNLALRSRVVPLWVELLAHVSSVVIVRRGPGLVSTTESSIWPTRRQLLYDFDSPVSHCRRRQLVA